MLVSCSLRKKREDLERTNSGRVTCKVHTENALAPQGFKLNPALRGNAYIKQWNFNQSTFLQKCPKQRCTFLTWVVCDSLCCSRCLSNIQKYHHSCNKFKSVSNMAITPMHICFSLLCIQTKTGNELLSHRSWSAHCCNCLHNVFNS